jgi:hypothetical protein
VAKSPDRFPDFQGIVMWIISSHEVEQAKERLSARRAEIEARYAAEKGALDAEVEAVETLERVAAEFAARNTRDAPAVAAPAEGVEPPGGGNPEETEAEIVGGPSPVPSAAGPVGGDDDAGGLDIVKPGSRWRFNRGARPASGEETAGGASAPSW